MTAATTTRTSVGIVGGGPAGLMLSHLLAVAWLTTMLHTVPGASDFDRRRQLGELESVAGSAYLAEGYTGWPGR